MRGHHTQVLQKKFLFIPCVALPVSKSKLHRNGAVMKPVCSSWCYRMVVVEFGKVNTEVDFFQEVTMMQPMLQLQHDLHSGRR